jgi:hypothetical protein
MRIYEAELNDELLKRLIDLSAEWEQEDISYGYRKNSREDIEPNRIFLASDGDEIIGYLLGHTEIAKRTSSVIKEGTPFFEIEELYVLPDRRSEGIGRVLFNFAEQKVKSEGLEYIMLSTSTKDYKSILHFYTDVMGMDFWNARLFKKLTQEQNG